jgi:hypothetical protein
MLALYKKGQALLELAILGPVIIMLLGILVNYGLRYTAEHRVKQMAFRKALISARNSPVSGFPISTTELVIRDMHVTDATDTFGIGSVNTFSSAASVTRNGQSDEMATSPSELPVMNIDLNGVIITKKAAGFRSEGIVDTDEDGNCTGGCNIDKYDLVYGSSNVDPTLGHVIDSCEGEVFSYSTCQKQCRMIINYDICYHECERNKYPTDTTSCSATCGMSIGTPWYCAPANPVGSPAATWQQQYNFPTLDNLFVSAAGRNSLGIQQDYTKNTTNNNQLAREEDETEIITTDTVHFREDTARELVYVPNNSDGSSSRSPQVTALNTAIQIDRNGVQWETEWR